MAAIAELDSQLQALLPLKAPGITKSRIASITTLFVQNVKSESILVQKIFTHFKRAPATHKLGVLYIIDAVSRQWIEKTAASGKDADASQDGTYAAGVNKITELLPTMMNDIITNAPYDQKEKISKLVDIWERGNTFPPAMVSSFKVKLHARQPDVEQQPQSIPQPSHQVPLTHTPIPPSQTPAQLLSSLGGGGGAAAVYPPPPTMTNGTTNGNAHYQHPPAPLQPPVLPAMPIPPPPATSALPALGITPEQAQMLSSVIPPHIANDPAALQQHLQLLQRLAQLKVPPEQWPTVIAAMNSNTATPAVLQPPPPSLPIPAPQPVHNQQPSRGRSRSPVRRRESPVYGTYQGNSNYRQRSPGSNTSSMKADIISLNVPSNPNWAEYDNSKWTDHDPSLPADYIKVLSRTLFVGGTQCGEHELRRIFSAFGNVQTCIPNPEKRHAFVKFTDRAGAVAAREGMSNITNDAILEKVRSVKWGVGFGPRDCNDYTTGISVIPIRALTDADKKWILTAQYGGSGNKPIVGGLVMEEPDIEIGAGVSSKAISRRVAGNETGRPRNTGNRGQENGFRRNDRNDRSYDRPRSPPGHYDRPNYEPQAVATYGLPPATTSYYGLPPAQGDQGQYRYG